MKKLLLVSALAAGSLSMFAQRQVAEQLDFSEKFANVGNALLTEAINDTIGPGVAQGCDTGPYLSLSSNGGYLAGTNGYGDLEKAQALATGAGTIHSVMVLFGGKSMGAAAGTSNYQAKIYELTSTGPGTQLGTTSSSVDFSSIDTTGGFTQFSFSSPVAYSTPVFASIVVDAGSGTDTIGILHTNGNCGNSSAWELWSDGTTWADINSGWSLDIALYIFVEVDETSAFSTDEHAIQRGSHKVFPNPAKNQAHLIYSLVNPASSVEITVYNVNGQAVSTFNQGAQNAGLQGVDLDVANLANGTYFYTISADGETSQGKFVVAN